MTEEDVCPDCGAGTANGRSCEEMFQELLAIEYSNPVTFGAVHHLTVACFYLQHSRDFGDAARETWRAIVCEVLDDDLTPATLLRRVRSQLKDRVRVREPGANPPPWWPQTWPLTVADVLPSPSEGPGPEGHIERVRRWAGSIRATLDASEGATRS